MTSPMVDSVLQDGLSLLSYLLLAYETAENITEQTPCCWNQGVWVSQSWQEALLKF